MTTAEIRRHARAIARLHNASLREGLLGWTQPPEPVERACHTEAAAQLRIAFSRPQRRILNITRTRIMN